jgi:hypothetical protein
MINSFLLMLEVYTDRKTGIPLSKLVPSNANAQTHSPLGLTRSCPALHCAGRPPSRVLRFLRVLWAEALMFLFWTVMPPSRDTSASCQYETRSLSRVRVRQICLQPLSQRLSLLNSGFLSMPHQLTWEFASRIKIPDPSQFLANSCAKIPLSKHPWTTHVSFSCFLILLK